MHAGGVATCSILKEHRLTVVNNRCHPFLPMTSKLLSGLGPRDDINAVIGNVFMKEAAMQSKARNEAIA